MDFANKPGQLFVLATLVPLASFLLLLICFGIRSALRSSKEGTAGASIYEMLGGDTPARWPAYLATLAIGLACVCSVMGFVQYLSDHAEVARLEKSVAENESLVKENERKLKSAAPDAKKRLQAEIRKAEKESDEARECIEKVEPRWKGEIEWVRVGHSGYTDEEGVKHEPRQGVVLSVGYRIDALNAVMFVMVTFVATLIHLFSIGYMADEKSRIVEDHQVHGEEGHLKRRGRFGRFFLFLSLFCFSMLNLILADNLFQVFVSWELVGICSYLLIGFYFERQSASNAANKAFITNRIGDAGFIIGLLILWTYCGTLNFDELFNRVRSPAFDTPHGDAASALPTAGRIVRGEVSEREFKDARGRSSTRNVFDVSADGSSVLIFPRKPHMHAHEFNFAEPDRPGGKTVTVHEQPVDIKPDPKENQFGSMPYWLLVAAGLGIFLGCVGKSAQFPLHVWLPDAMEGPTPVSALIHAATMVAAGVYLVGRCFPLFTAEALLVIAYTGAVTLFVAATIAVVMTDIKKVLAYSTVSQLGYMMLALGVGGWVAGLFHLVTHAFFKALLFLGSGSVIAGCHHEQEMTKMGGLYPKMKITALTMLMGVLAIAGIPAFSGWYSKDAIVAQALGFAYFHPHHALLFLLPLLTAGLTTFYMFRMWLMTFTGKPRDHHVYEHARESPPVMTLPLIVLALFSVGVGWGWPFFSSHFPFVDAESSWLEHTIHHAQPLSVQADFGVNKADIEAGMVYPGTMARAADASERVKALELQHLAGNLALAMVVIGIVFSFALYYYRVLDPAEAKAQVPGGYRFLSHKWYFDELYSAILVRPALAIAYWCKTIDLKAIDKVLDTSAAWTVRVARSGGKFDNGVIDGLVNLTATVSDGIAGWFRKWQTGYLRSYILFLVMGAVGLFVLLSYLMTMAG
jgi:NADH-quinone oxidoreductase subunit L